MKKSQKTMTNMTTEEIINEIHEQLQQCGRPLPKGEKEDECKTEVQEAKEENRAARESKDAD